MVRRTHRIRAGTLGCRVYARRKVRSTRIAEPSSTAPLPSPTLRARGAERLAVTHHRLLDRLPVRGVMAPFASLCLVTLGLVAVPAAPAHAVLTQAVRAQALAQGVTLTDPGGDLTASMSDGSTSAAAATQYLDTFEEGLGLSAGASLSGVFQALYNKMGGATPTVPAPPSFSGGTLSVSGNTITATIPSSYLPANARQLPGGLAGALGAILGGLAAAVIYVACVGLVGLLGGVVAAGWVNSLCTAIAFFFWSFVGIIFFDWATDVPLDATAWETILAYSLASAALGLGWPYLSRYIVAFFARFFGQAAPGAAGAILQLEPWVGGSAGAQAATSATTGALSSAETAATPAELGGIVTAANMAAPEQTGAVTSGFAGQCMDAYGSNGGASVGQIVAINACNGNPAQDWTTWSDNAVSVWGLCLDTVGGGTTEGTAVYLTFCDGASSQVWQQMGKALVNQKSGMCLDDPGSNTSAGTQLQIWACNGTAAQEWILPGNSGGSGGSPPSLRVLPFGDSITYGYASSNGSGYRCDLQSLLSTRGYAHQFVGSLTAGSGCSQEENEGHSGWTIPELASIEHCTIAGFQPNVVLLDIGTNDINRGGSVSTAVSNIESLIQAIFADDPGVTVLDAGLIATPNATVAANMQQFNQEVSSWINAEQASGARVAFVSMSAITTSDLADGLHPDDHGYQLMASAWNLGLLQAVGSGWIQPANPEGTGCGSLGTGPTWVSQGEIATGPPGGVASGGHIAFAPVYGSGRDDYLYVEPSGAVEAWYNDGDVSGQQTWDCPMIIATGTGSPGSEVQFADLTGHGLADYLVVNPTSGAVSAWENAGPDGDSTRHWTPLGQIATGPPGGVASGGHIAFADLTGNGLADYLYVEPNSAVEAWLNGGPTPSGWNWIPAGTIANGVGASGSQVQFANVNGGNIADYLDVKSNSAVQEWLNGGQSSGGWNWASAGTIATGTGVAGSEVQFAELTGSGRAEYLDVDPSSGAVTAWFNGSTGYTSGGGVTSGSQCNGSNTTPPSGAGGPGNGITWSSAGTVTGYPTGGHLQFAPVYGSGRADLLDIAANGSVEAWYNAGVSNGAIRWTCPAEIAGGVGAPGAEVQFAQLGGNGRSAYLVVDPSTGSVQAWFPVDNTWSDQGYIATGPPGGVPAGGHVAFADLTGDGLADYLLVGPDSSVQAWLNGGYDPSAQDGWLWIPAGTIATGVGAPGSQIRFADMEGGGRADYLNVEPSSAAQEWQNGGQSGSGWNWTPLGTIATGVGDVGNDIQFAELTGSRRADYIDVNQSNDSISFWLNGTTGYTATGNGTCPPLP